MPLVYSLVANRIGTSAALDLADELRTWHDAMVRHARAQAGLGHSCADTDGCPHTEALELWQRARRTFGAEADELIFLRESAGDSVRGV